MQAFPEGSANNALGGGGPVNRAIDYDTYHGRGREGFSDFNDSIQHATRNELPIRSELPLRAQTSGSNEVSSGFRRPHQPERARLTKGPPDNTYNVSPHESFNPKAAVQPVHGDSSAGLGTSTFLEGTPASRRELAQRESENENNGPVANGGGLQRKRSIAQKIRGISRPRPGMVDAGRVQSQEASNAWAPYGQQVTSPGSPQYISSAPQSAGGRAKVVEANPFFNEPTDKKAANVTVAPVGESSSRMRTASSPTRGMGRVRNSEDADGEQKPIGGGGLLGRMKSLKGKKSRPERFASGA